MTVQLALSLITLVAVVFSGLLIAVDLYSLKSDIHINDQYTTKKLHEIYGLLEVMESKQYNSPTMHEIALLRQDIELIKNHFDIKQPSVSEYLSSFETKKRLDDLRTL